MNEVGKGKKTGITKLLVSYLESLPGQEATAAHLAQAFPKFTSKQIRDALRNSSLVEASVYGYRNPMWKIKNNKPAVNEKLRQDIREWLQKMVPQTMGAIQAKFRDRATRKEVSEAVDADDTLVKTDYDGELCYTVAGPAWVESAVKASETRQDESSEVPSKQTFAFSANAKAMAARMLADVVARVEQTGGHVTGGMHDEILVDYPDGFDSGSMTETPNLAETPAATLAGHHTSPFQPENLTNAMNTQEEPMPAMQRFSEDAMRAAQGGLAAAVAKDRISSYQPEEVSNPMNIQEEPTMPEVSDPKHPLRIAFDLVKAREDSEEFKRHSFGWERLVDTHGSGVLTGQVCQIIEFYAQGGRKDEILDAILWIALNISYNRSQDGMATLCPSEVFDLAVHQVTKGKGVRHGGDSVPFYEQWWKHYAEVHGRGFLTGQAQKNFVESLKKTGEDRERGQIEAVAWLGMAVLKDHGYPEKSNGPV